jgi:hypothetical protein
MGNPMTAVEPDRQWALLRLLYDAKHGAPVHHSGSVNLDAVAQRLGVSRSEAVRLVIQLRDRGLAATDSLDTVRIESEGVRQVEEEARVPREFILKNKDFGGYRLIEPHPTSVSDIREAMNEALSIMNDTAGPGALAYNEAEAIHRLLQSDLQIALAQQTTQPAPSIHIGEMRDSTIQQGTGNVHSSASGVDIWTTAWTIATAVIAGLILYFVFGIG